MRIIYSFFTKSFYLRLVLFAFITTPFHVSAQQFVISEVMFNPNGNENAREFVELVNLSENDESLEGFLIGDGEGFDTITPAADGTWVVPAGSYALIFDPDYFTSDEPYDTLPPGIPLFTVDDQAIGSRGLSNSTAETVYLISDDGDTLSAVIYSLDCTPGHSWERISLSGGDSSDNFRQSDEAEGTPGRTNSALPESYNPVLNEESLRFNPSAPQMNGQLEIFVSYQNAGTEMISDIAVAVSILPGIELGSVHFPETVEPGMKSAEVSIIIDSVPGGRIAVKAVIVSDAVNPAADDTVTVLLDVQAPQETIILNEVMASPSSDSSEWIEIFNRSESPVDLFNWAVRDSRGTSIGRVTEHSFVKDHGYAVLSEGIMQYDVPDESPVIIIEGFPSFNNDGDSVRLFDYSETLVDSMNYDTVQYGKSFELISPDAEGTGSAWDICVDPHGATPGEQNSIYYSPSHETDDKNTKITLSVTPNPFSETTTVSYYLPFPLARVRLSVYDRRGRFITNIRDVEESGSEWTGVWDGRSNGSQLPAGPYILNLEAMNKSSGRVITERTTIVIGRRL